MLAMTSQELYFRASRTPIQQSHTATNLIVERHRPSFPLPAQDQMIKGICTVVPAYHPHSVIGTPLPNCAERQEIDNVPIHVPRVISVSPFKHPKTLSFSLTYSKYSLAFFSPLSPFTSTHPRFLHRLQSLPSASNCS